MGGNCGLACWLRLLKRVSCLYLGSIGCSLEYVFMLSIKAVLDHLFLGGGKSGRKLVNR